MGTTFFHTCFSTSGVPTIQFKSYVIFCVCIKVKLDFTRILLKYGFEEVLRKKKKVGGYSIARAMFQNSLHGKDKQILTRIENKISYTTPLSHKTLRTC